MLDKLKTYFALKDGPGRSSFFSWNAPVFLFTNENVSGYLERIGGVSGKDVLSVAAGGDHAFISLLSGANNVDMFDLNYLQKHIVELKSKMIKYLPYSDFMHFFFDNNRFFSSDIIRPIWKTFSPGLKTFLLMYYRHKNNRIFRYASAQHMDYDVSQIPYLSNESDFRDLSKLVPEKFHFEQTDITKISKKFTQKYDVILLSNIFEYMYPDVCDLSERMLFFYNSVLCPVADNNLSQLGGKICLHYAWRTEPAQWEKFMNSFQHYVANSIDDFNLCHHKFSTVDIKSTCKQNGSFLRPSDVALVMTQNLKQW